MINLQKTSGLPIELTDDFLLKFNPPMKEFPITFARKFSEMVPVLLDANVKPPVEVTYFVYRGLHLPEHEELIRRTHLTYDVTILPAMMLGKEFNKTVGHYHANIPGTNLAHPELYQVLHGHGLFLLQKLDEKMEKIMDVIVVQAKAGDQIIYPPNYGHNFINIGSEPLITANWLSIDYKPLYEPIRDKHGMGYYVVKSENGYEFVTNSNYENIPKIREQEPVLEQGPMYVSGLSDINKLAFLNNPNLMLK